MPGWEKSPVSGSEMPIVIGPSEEACFSEFGVPHAARLPASAVTEIAATSRRMVRG